MKKEKFYLNKMKVAVFDIDGTLLKSSCEKIFIKSLIKKRLIRFKHGILTSIDILEKIPKLRSDVFKSTRRYYSNLNFKEINDLAEQCFEKKIKFMISKKMMQLIKRHKSKGYKIILLSGASEILTNKIGAYVNADFIISTKLEEKNGFLTGYIADKHIYGKNKLDSLKHKFKDIDFLNSYCYADHFSDIPLLKEFGHPIAVNPHFILRIYRLFKKWSKINF